LSLECILGSTDSSPRKPECCAKQSVGNHCFYLFSECVS